MQSNMARAGFGYLGKCLAEDVTITHPDLVNFYGCAIGTATRVGPFVESSVTR